MKRLEIFEKHVEEAFSLLGEHSLSFCNSDGSHPTGSGWIAKDDLPNDIMQKVVLAGCGRTVEAFVWNDERVRAHLQFEPLEESDQEGYDGSFINIEPSLIHSHYGILGTSSSIWICSQEDAYLLPEERMELFKLAMMFSNLSPKEEN